MCFDTNPRLILNSVAQIEKPDVFAGDANNLSELLVQVANWHDCNRVNLPDVHLRVWYRGHSDQTYILWPGVYRPEFTAASVKTMYGKDAEERRLNLERHMLDEFRISGATLLNPDAEVEVYFAAQHSGMPTRLLDWTMNPLAALFFAVKERNEDKDGEVLIMDAPKLLPEQPEQPRVPKSIVGMRHPYVKEAIGVSFWNPKVSLLPALVLLIRPDNQAGRIGQQSSCFTLHMHGAKPCNNPTLRRIRIPGKAKPGMLAELRKLNINEFSIYNDLDHLAQEIKRTRLDDKRMNFKTGDVVQLKSGGPNMTVEEVKGTQAICVWFVGTKREDSWFEMVVLKPAS